MKILLVIVMLYSVSVIYMYVGVRSQMSDDEEVLNTKGWLILVTICFFWPISLIVCWTIDR